MEESIVEEWRPVVGMESSYEISNIGRVKTKHNKGKHPEGGIISQSISKKGYPRVNLCHNGKPSTVPVHRLVLDAFVQIKPSRRHQANHKDGIKTNNSPSNLEWVTPKENFAHAIAHGLFKHVKGEKSGRAKLSESAARAILKLQGILPSDAVGKLYGVSRTTVYMIWKKRNWKHIQSNGSFQQCISEAAYLN